MIPGGRWVSSYRRRKVMLALAISAAFLISGVGIESASAATRPRLAVSLNPDRSNAVRLDGSTLKGKIYVFVGNSNTPDKVDFYLDSSSRTTAPVRTDTDPPFDFAGTAEDGTALPYDTTKLTNGSHSIRVVLTWSNGTTSRRGANFTVVNNGVAPTTNPSPTTSATASPATTNSASPPAPSTTETPTLTPDPTTETPTSTPTLTADCAPVTIRAGGTYNGCYRSTDPDIPAVTISTTSAVVLDAAQIEHAGVGVRSQVSGADITVTNSTVQRLDPGVAVDGRAVRVDNAASLVVENNDFVDGNGIYQQVYNGTPLTGGAYRYNTFTNVGRYKRGYGDLLQAIDLDKIDRPGLEIAWNKVTNDYGKSAVEDVFNLYLSDGTSTDPIQIHHNLVDGAWPTSLTGTYNGGGIMLDSQSSWVRIHDNTVVNTINHGISILGGHDNRIYDNTVITDARNEAGQTVSNGTSGIVVWDFFGYSGWGNNWADHNTIGSLLASGSRSDLNIPDCSPSANCAANTGLPNPIDVSDEQDARAAWDPHGGVGDAVSNSAAP